MTSIPDPSARMTTDAGHVDPTWFQFFKTLARGTNATTGGGTTDDDAASRTQEFTEAAYIEFPANKEYVFVSNSIDGTIDAVICQTQSGNCTVTVKINGVALGGGSTVANANKRATGHSSQNELTRTDDISIQVANVNNAEGLSVTIRGTQELA